MFRKKPKDTENLGNKNSTGTMFLILIQGYLIVVLVYLWFIVPIL